MAKHEEEKEGPRPNCLSGEVVRKRRVEWSGPTCRIRVASDRSMEGKNERRLKAVENQLEAMGITVDGLKAETVAMRQDSTTIHQDLQEVMHILGGRNRDHKGASDESQSSVNGDRRGRREEENEGRETEQRDRVDLLNWINRAERFFELQGVAEEEKVNITYVSMGGSADYWYRFWREKARDRTWEGLKCAMIGRFGERSRGTIFERLAANCQTGTVEEYINDFEILVGQTKGVMDEQLLCYFLAGLQDNVRGRVRPHDQQELLAAMRITKDVEIRLEGAKTGGGSANRPPISRGRTAGTIVREDERRVQRVWDLGEEKRTRGSVREEAEGCETFPITSISSDVKKANFGPGHRCPGRSLQVLILGEDKEEDPGETKKELANMRLELSSPSARGMTQPRTMKLLGSVGDKEVLIMVNSGASHNFISKTLVEELQLEVNKDQMRPVCLGDGHRKQTQECCQGVMLQLGGVEIAEQYHVFELGGVNMILGVDWLATLGEVVTNWGKLTMSFKQGEREVTIRGDPTLARKITEVETVAVMWGLKQMEVAGRRGEEQGFTVRRREELEETLSEFQQEFNDYSTNNFNFDIPPDARTRLFHSFPSGTIKVLKLQHKKFNGNIPDKFPVSCALKTMDLNSNLLKGTIPKSLQNCSSLEVLDLKNNEVDDGFPNFLNSISTFRVLVLRRNKFHGHIECADKCTWPIRILNKRQQQLEEEIREQALIEWNEGGVDGATWEEQVTIQEQFSEFNLEDKEEEKEGPRPNCLSGEVVRKRRIEWPLTIDLIKQEVEAERKANEEIKKCPKDESNSQSWSSNSLTTFWLVPELAKSVIEKRAEKESDRLRIRVRPNFAVEKLTEVQSGTCHFRALESTGDDDRVSVYWRRRWLTPKSKRQALCHTKNAQGPPLNLPSVALCGPCGAARCGEVVDVSTGLCGLLLSSIICVLCIDEDVQALKRM
ncbi:hypothetical protein V8G54_025801 [Vigna mungo]|uniref:Retrotransposon gag domain-containing protein n=1 Tax=Vigna mungo TaxID=3915 RepID=A0AAQ3RML8_VIGMU